MTENRSEDVRGLYTEEERRQKRKELREGDWQNRNEERIQYRRGKEAHDRRGLEMRQD
jgi:hypothetical protein